MLAIMDNGNLQLCESLIPKMPRQTVINNAHANPICKWLIFDMFNYNITV